MSPLPASTSPGTPQTRESGSHTLVPSSRSPIRNVPMKCSEVPGGMSRGWFSTKSPSTPAARAWNFFASSISANSRSVRS